MNQEIKPQGTGLTSHKKQFLVLINYKQSILDQNYFTSINSNRQSWSERTSQQTSTSFLSHISSSLSNNQNISTVGIDINEWIYEKANKKKSLE